LNSATWRCWIAAKSQREYALVGLLRCGLCGRRLDAHWVHGRAGYRCRHGFASGRSRPADSPRNVYVREDVILAQLGERLVMDRDGVVDGGHIAPLYVK